jgi:hypothetical protein
MNDEVKGDAKTEGKSWVSIFDSKETVVRFLFTSASVAAIAVLVLLFAALIIEYVVVREVNEVEFHEGTTTYKLGHGEPEKSTLLLPATRPWTNTHISLGKKDAVDIEVTGAINVAIHRLVQSSDDGKRPRFPWVGPDGLVEQSCVDKSRQNMKLAPELNVGEVIAFIQTPGAMGPLEYNNKRPPNIKEVGEHTQIALEGEGTLWLGVNDQWIVPEYRQFYISTTDDCLQKEGYKRRGTQVKRNDLATRFDKYTEDGNADAFYQDNVGEFLVQITKKKD